jgi:exopolysaccharide biosynthesis protein
MPAKHILKLACLFCLLASSLLACNIVPTISISLQNTPTSNGTPFNTWMTVKPGVELRYEHWTGVAGDEDNVVITRINPHQVHFTVDYSPTKPMSMQDWMKQTGATVLINGGYFNTQDEAEALIISNGQPEGGASYQNCCGMFQVDAQGNATVRSLVDQPYDPTEQLHQATQSSPMLILNGKPTQFEADSSSNRRTVVAMDTQGNILFIVCPSQSLSLVELQDLLAKSDLSIQTALNLDGGSSTGMYVNGQGNTKVTINSMNLLPIVIAVK